MVEDVADRRGAEVDAGAVAMGNVVAAGVVTATVVAHAPRSAQSGATGGNRLLDGLPSVLSDTQSRPVCTTRVPKA